MAQELPTILITPEARAALVAEVERSSGLDPLTGGLLFGYPPDEHRWLVLSSTRLSSDVGFGRSDFSLDQTRTSRQLEHARQLNPKANYCGIWYLHRTPDKRLTDEEWVQMQTLLEDPDFVFDDLVCLLLCFYYAELKIYPYIFTRHQSARGQAPSLTQMRLTTEAAPAETRRQPARSALPTDWYKAPVAAARLEGERRGLMDKYHVQLAPMPDGRVFFRLSPKRRYHKLTFYLVAMPGFPDRAPQLYLLVGGQPQRITCPALTAWTASKSLVELADELVEWLAFSREEYLRIAQEALEQGEPQKAADLLTVVLSIEPRTPGAARLLARAQAHARV